MTSLPKTESLNLDLDRGWLTIWFNRPENRNALSDELTGELLQVLNAVRDDRTVRGITFRGRGGVFCAGGDLKAFKQMGSATPEEALKATTALSEHAATLFHTINSVPQVTIAMIEGAAMAGGFGLTCTMDFAVATPDTLFSLSETRIGITPAQIAPYVVARLGRRKGRQLMITGGRFKGDEALSIGLVDALSGNDQALEDIEAAYKSDVMKCAPGAIATTKDLVAQIGRLPQDEFASYAAHGFAKSLVGPEGREGIASFLEKRKPNWTES